MKVDPHSILLYPTVHLLDQMNLLISLKKGIHPTELTLLEESQRNLLQKIFNYLENMCFLEKKGERYFLSESIQVNAYIDLLKNRDVTKIFEKMNSIFNSNQKPDLGVDTFNPLLKHRFYNAEQTPQMLDEFLFSKAYRDGKGLSSAWSFPDKFSFVDLGGGGGGFALGLTEGRLDVKGVVTDLPEVAEVFKKRKEASLSNAVNFKAGDIFEGELPMAQFYFLRLVLHDFGKIAQKQALSNIFLRIPDTATLVIGERMVDLPLRFDRITASIEDLVLSTEAYLNSAIGTEYKFEQFQEQLWDAGFFIEKIIRQDVNYFFCRKRSYFPSASRCPERMTDLVCEIPGSDWPLLNIDRDPLGNIFEIYFSNKAGTKRKKFDFSGIEGIKLRNIFARVTTLFLADNQNFDGRSRFGFLVSRLKLRFPFLIYAFEPVEFKLQADCSWALFDKKNQKIKSL